MSMYQEKIADVVRHDPRYPYEAYEFVFAALTYTQQALGRQRRDESGDDRDASIHVSGPELLHGIRDFALHEFGLMARTVFRRWGINCTDDFGEIIFNLIEANLMSKTPQDSRRDFHAVYDLDEELMNGYRIRLDEAE
jgi:uncharacterized repeat protein (TIGR04138 family)